MALIKCPECGKDISDKAGKCPECGCPIKKIRKRYIILGITIAMLTIVIGAKVVKNIQGNATPFDKIDFGFTKEKVYKVLGKPDEEITDTIHLYNNKKFKGLKGNLEISYDDSSNTVYDMEWSFELEDKKIFSDYPEIEEIMKYYEELYGVAMYSESYDYYIYKFDEGGIPAVDVWFDFDEEGHADQFRVNLRNQEYYR